MRGVSRAMCLQAPAHTWQAGVGAGLRLHDVQGRRPARPHANVIPAEAGSQIRLPGDVPIANTNPQPAGSWQTGVGADLRRHDVEGRRPGVPTSERHPGEGRKPRKLPRTQAGVITGGGNA